MRCRNTKQSAFTLIETILYIAVIVIVLVGIVSTLAFAARTLGELRASRDVRNSALTTLERMTREIRKADSIDVGQTTFDTSPGQLTLNTTDDMGAPTTVEFYVEDSVVKLRSGGSYAGDLTLPTASTTGFVVQHITTSSSEGVKVELTLESLADRATTSMTFYASAILRNSYGE